MNYTIIVNTSEYEKIISLKVIIQFDYCYTDRRASSLEADAEEVEDFPNTQ